MSTKQTVKLNYLRMAPRKVRSIADLVKGLSVNEAEAQLALQPRRAAKPLLKLLRSAVANAKTRRIDTDKLVIESFRVDGGPMLKRMLPRARGMASPIQKKMSHVTLILAETATPPRKRFQIVVPKKTKAAPAKSEDRRKKTEGEPDEKKTQERKPQEKKPGFFRRTFNRKSI